MNNSRILLTTPTYPYPTLPESMGCLSSLKILNLNFNKFIIKIPESIKVLQNNGLKIHKQH